MEADVTTWLMTPYTFFCQQGIENFNFNLFSVHLIHMGYDPSDMELVNTEIRLQKN